MWLKKEVLIGFFVLIAQQNYGQKYPQGYFAPPLDIPLYLSGTFGELRTNHFHSGIDIKTNQREGQRVLASAEGSIVRIKVSPYGFGNALYVKHPNGYTTVYAHLQRFNDEIRQYVRQEQYRLQSFEVELFPPAGRFHYKQGDLIALSGNSGGSGGPHLHFEIRDTRTEKIINPLLFGFPVKDTRPPDLYSLEVYEFHDKELVSSYARGLLKGADGKYTLTGSNLLEVNHLPAFGVQTFDRLDGASNQNGVYSIELWIDNEPFYDFTIETFAFDETRFVNSHIDYAQKICCRRTVQKLYLDPNNFLSVYGFREKLRMPGLLPDSVYPVRLEVKDAAGNTSVLLFNLKYTPLAENENVMTEPPGTVFRYSQPNFFKEENIQITLPQGALYNDLYFVYERRDPCSECLSYVHQLASREIPVHKYYTLKIRPNEEFKGDKNKLCIASFKDGHVDDYEGGTWEDGFVVTRTRQFGEFAIVSDTVAPTIKAVSFRDGADVSAFGRLKFIIDDNFSGVEEYTPAIDGKWVLFEYDAKNNLIYADLADLPVEKGEHVLKLAVKDAKGNSIEKTYHLIF